MTRFEESITNIVRDYVERSEGQVATLRRDLLATGCQPDQLPERIRDYRQSYAESLAVLLAAICRKAIQIELQGELR